jgi:hypothetical protein
MMQAVVQTYPVQHRLPCYDLDFGSRLVKQRGALKGALASSNYDNALSFEPA